ncbi:MULTISPECIES: Hsp33 family molecular chaperone HslO [unclassified Exiguobacterium]|uniref:Hsp33 family molecular chaperone HslO n=1 Tax=unclassified Exiguobacterium TaxID=2644629 RepID=UPI002553E4A2|nr:MULTISPECIES: Hsp33 family molecular chaperone HslO [unclassified Exiguobacterium]
MIQPEQQALLDQMKADYLVRALGFNGEVRAFAVRTTKTIFETQLRHQTTPVASAALGRTMTIGTMIGAMQKGAARVTLKVEGDGPIGKIIVDADAAGDVRGYVSHPRVEGGTFVNDHGLTKLKVGEAVGRGTISVIKDLGLKDFVGGSSEIQTGEISEDFTYYFATSEQVPSVVGAGVLVLPEDESILAAGGIIVQLMPDASEETIQALEQALKTFPPVSVLIGEEKTPEEMLHMLLGDSLEVLDQKPVQFNCTCGRDRMESAIIGLGAEEIRHMIEEDGGAEAVCHFCGEKYHFSAEQLETMKQQAR